MEHDIMTITPLWYSDRVITAFFSFITLLSLVFNSNRISLIFEIIKWPLNQWWFCTLILFIRTTLSEKLNYILHPHTSSYGFWLKKWLIWIQKPCTFICQLSTVTPCTGAETILLRVQCSAVNYKAFFLYFLLFANYPVLFWLISNFFLRVSKYLIWTLFILYFYLLCHQSDRYLCIHPYLTTWRYISGYHPPMKEAHFNRVVHISIFMTSFVSCRWMLHR